MRLFSFVALLLLAPASAATTTPQDFGDFAYQQKLGNQLPLQTRFRDEAGEEMALGKFMAGKPLILALGYFHCPNLCGVVRADLLDALGKTGMTGGRDYSLVALSIDPAETSADAEATRADDLSRYDAPGAEQGWHFLTGSPEAVQAVADAVGFRDRFDPQLKQFLHPAGIVFVTPHGIVSSYILGINYLPADVRLGVTRADLGSVASLALPVLLLCYHYDSTTGRYTLAIMKLVRLAGVITAVTLGGTLFLAFRGERRA